MAVGKATVSRAARSASVHSGPVRTCVGCRRTAPAAELLRVAAGPADGAGVVPLVPDRARRAGGRGAWVHPVPECVALAVRRRAFGRALRLTARTEASALVRHVEQFTE